MKKKHKKIPERMKKGIQKRLGSLQERDNRSHPIIPPGRDPETIWHQTITFWTLTEEAGKLPHWWKKEPSEKQLALIKGKFGEGFIRPGMLSGHVSIIMWLMTGEKANHFPDMEREMLRMLTPQTEEQETTEHSKASFACGAIEHKDMLPRRVFGDTETMQGIPDEHIHGTTPPHMDELNGEFLPGRDIKDQRGIKDINVGLDILEGEGHFP